jgi:hypothetical protein
MFPRIRPVAVLLIGLLWLMSACSPAPEALPTIAPTATTVAISVTNTPPPPTVTRTPTLTPTPSLPIPKTRSDNPTEQASLRVVNASPNVGPVDFYIDGLKLASFLDFRQFIEPSGIVAGEYTLRVVPQGAKTLTEPLLSLPLTVLGSTSQMLILTGKADALTMTIVAEELRPLSGGQSRLIAVNTLSNQATISTFNGNNALVADTAYGSVSESVLLPTEEIALNVRVNGAIAYAKNVRLRERQNYTLIAIDNPQKPDMIDVLTITTPIDGLGVVTVVNATDGLTLDFYANTQIIAPQMGNRYVSEPINLAAISYDLTIYESGADPNTVQPLLQDRLTVLPDQEVTLILMGTANDLRIVDYRPATQPTTADKARVIFLNTLPNAPKVQAQANIEFNLVANYGILTNSGELNSGELSLTWYEYENGNIVGEPLEYQASVALNAGSEYLYILTGRSDLPAFTIEQTVGVQPPTASELIALGTPQVASYFYAINAVEGLTINVSMDDIPLATNLASRTGNSSTIIPESEHTFTANRVDTGELIARLTAPIETAKSYAAVVYGRAETGYQILLIGEDIMDNPANVPTIRLINASQIGTSMGVGLFASTGNNPPFPDFNAPVDPITGFVPSRTSLPIGLKRIFKDVLSLTASQTLFLFDAEGLQDIYTIDVATTQASNILPSFVFEAGKHYDIVALQDPTSGIVTTYVVATTKP